MKPDHSRVSPEGKALGAQLVGLTEPAIAMLVTEGEPDDRCSSCAFRPGTVPNGCLQTQMDAFKSVLERVPFNCHQHDRKGWPCHGWFALAVSMKDAEKRRGEPFPITECPWPFSPPDEEVA